MLMELLCDLVRDLQIIGKEALKRCMSKDEGANEIRFGFHVSTLQVQYKIKAHRYKNLCLADSSFSKVSTFMRSLALFCADERTILASSTFTSIAWSYHSSPDC